jgi:iron(III) transport system ATP-binding protein
VNFLEGRLAAAGADTATVEVRGHRLEVPLRRPDVRPGDPVTLVVRPETIRVTESPAGGAGGFAGRIRRVVYLGSSVEYEIEWEGERLLAVGSNPLEQGLLPEGAPVVFGFPSRTAHLLPQGAAPSAGDG